VSTNESLTRQAQHHKTLLKEFTKQWKQEYCYCYTTFNIAIQHLIALEMHSKFGNEDEEKLVDVNEE
jgi:hypothetical protein